jgi:hypothetical protein
MSLSSRKELGKLKAHWYNKLKESGFKDIETRSGTTGRKNQKEGLPNIEHRVPLQIEIIDQYYSMASSFAHDHNFETELEKTIWIYHSEGLSVREIATTLIKAGIKQHKKDTVNKIIRNLEDLMKKKYLSP